MSLEGPVQLDRAVFPITGAEAADFLQNLLTQDVARLAHQPVVYAGLLTPQGKVAFDFLLWRGGPGFLVDVAAARANALIEKLVLHRLRAKVEIGPIDTALGVWAAPTGPASDPRLPALGARAIAPAAPAPRDEPQAYRSLRLALGVPDIVHDGAENDAFALEALFEELHGVDFKKGCFVGQENVSRMKRRATTRRKFCPIAFEGAAPPFAAIITAGSAEIGDVREGMDGRALAFVRLDRAAEAREPLMAAGKPVRLDPPDWLIQPG